jgi:hypothetical protein
MPASRDPVKRQAQLANLRNGKTPTHGAQSEVRVRPLRERYLAELAVTYPNATDHELVIQAQRLAQLELLGAFLDERGVIRHRRRGDVFPAASLAEKIASAYERQAAVLAERERQHGKSSPHDALRAIVAELTEGGSDADA